MAETKSTESIPESIGDLFSESLSGAIQEGWGILEGLFVSPFRSFGNMIFGGEGGGKA